MSWNGDDTAHLQGLEPVHSVNWKFFLAISGRLADTKRCQRGQAELLGR